MLKKNHRIFLKNNPGYAGLFFHYLISPDNLNKYSNKYFAFKHYRLIILLLFLFSVNFSLSQQRDLNFYLQSAYNNDTTIYNNTQLLSSYNIRKEIVRSSTILPLMNITANYLFAPTFHSVGYDSAITNGGLYSALFNFDYPLFRGPALDVKLKSTAIEQNTFKNSILNAKHEIDKNVTDKYLKTYLDLKQIENTKEILEILKTERSIIVALASQGLYKISDIKLFDIESQDLAITQVKQENTYKGDIYDLNLLANVHDTNIILITEPDIAVNPDVVNSNFFIQFQLDSLSIVNQQEQIDLNYKPQLDVFFNAGLNAVTYIDIQKKFGFSTGINFTFSLYDGNQRSLNSQFTRIKMDILSTNEQKFIIQNRLRKDNLIKELNDVEGVRKAQQTQIENYQSLLDLYREEIPSGQVSIVDFINTVKNYVNFRSDIISTENQRLSIINEFNYWNW